MSEVQYAEAVDAFAALIYSWWQNQSYEQPAGSGVPLDLPPPRRQAD